MERMSPRKRNQERPALYDTTGMDPDMRQTLGSEMARRSRVRAATSPYAQAADQLGGLIKKMFKKRKGGK